MAVNHYVVSVEIINLLTCLRSADSKQHSEKQEEKQN